MVFIHFGKNKKQNMKEVGGYTYEYDNIEKLNNLKT